MLQSPCASQGTPAESSTSPNAAKMQRLTPLGPRAPLRRRRRQAGVAAQRGPRWAFCCTGGPPAPLPPAACPAGRAATGARSAASAASSRSQACATCGHSPS
eukprot:2837150-Pyramimonas_sp.AAC.1